MRPTLALMGTVLVLALAALPTLAGPGVTAPPGQQGSSDQCASMNGYFSSPVARCWAVEGDANAGVGNGKGKFYLYFLTSDDCVNPTLGIWQENGQEAGLQTKPVSTRDIPIAATCSPWNDQP